VSGTVQRTVRIYCISAAVRSDANFRTNCVQQATLQRLAAAAASNGINSLLRFISRNRLTACNECRHVCIGEDNKLFCTIFLFIYFFLYFYRFSIVGDFCRDTSTVLFLYFQQAYQLSERTEEMYADRV